MKRLKPICKCAALLAAVLLCLPLLGLAVPAAEAGTLDSATVSGSDTPTVGDSTEPPTESGDPAPEPTTPPEPSYTITILSPSGWYTKAANVEIRVEDVNGTSWKNVEYKIERGGSWIDLTDRNRAKVEITENCTLYVTVTDKDGKAHAKSRYVECFDRTAPTVKAGIDGRLLRVEASDELSGVDAIYIDGDRYGGLTNGTLDVRLRDLGDDYSQLSIQAVDYAGNKSKTVQVKNPNYEEPNSKKTEDKKDPATSCPDTNKPTTTPTPTAPPAPTPSPGTTGGTSGGASTGKPTGGTSSQPVKEERGPSPLTPDGQATVVDNATGEDGKEFYTIVTPAENTFYLVIDKQRETENVYFLNAVTESDLLALAEKDDGTGGTRPGQGEQRQRYCDCRPCGAGRWRGRVLFQGAKAQEGVRRRGRLRGYTV